MGKTTMFSPRLLVEAGKCPWGGGSVRLFLCGKNKPHRHPSASHLRLSPPPPYPTHPHAPQGCACAARCSAWATTCSPSPAHTTPALATASKWGRPSTLAWVSAGAGPHRRWPSRPPQLRI